MALISRSLHEGGSKPDAILKIDRMLKMRRVNSIAVYSILLRVFIFEYFGLSYFPLKNSFEFCHMAEVQPINL